MASHDRRGFLRGLASLPLIGGSVALIGSPTKAAVPVTRAMLADYADWLAVERDGTLRELYGTLPGSAMLDGVPLFDRHRAWPDMSLSPPSTRAAVILSAAGVPLE